MGKLTKSRFWIVTMLVAATMIVALGGCGSDEPDPTPTPTQAAAVDSQPAPQPTPTPTQSSTSGAQAPATDSQPEPPAPTPTEAATDAGGTDSSGTEATDADLSDYFAGKDVNVLVGSAPGGGYDLLARLIARFAPRHLPGPDSFRISNVVGGGGLRAWEKLIRAEPDGLTILTLNINLVRQVLLGQEVEGLHLETLPLIGSPTWVSDPYLICGDRNKYSSWEDLLADGNVTIAGGTGGRVPMGAHFVELVDGPMKTIPGYEGSTETLAAFERGELEASTCIQRRDPRLLPELVEENRWLPLFWWNTRPDQGWLDTLGAPEPYHIYDLPGIDFQDWQKTAFDATVKFNDFLRMYVVHPDTPPELVQAWQEAYENLINDPEFVEAANIAGYDVGFGPPEDFGKVLQDLAGLPPEGIQLVLRLSGIN